MSGRAGYRSVSAKNPCPVCGGDSWCRITTDAFRIVINRSGVKEEVSAPGTVMCMRSDGAQPGFSTHGAKGTNGGQHYVPHSVYAQIKGGTITGEQFDEEKARKRDQERKKAEYEERMAKRKMAGKVWAMARSRGEMRLKAITSDADGTDAADFSASDRSTLMYLEAVAYLNTRLGLNAPVHENVRLVREPRRTVGDVGLPYCIRSLDRLGLYEVSDTGEVVHQGDHPALLGAMIAPDGKVAAVQRIYLERDSRRKLAGGESSKKIIGDPCPGAAVRIGTPEQFGQVRDADGNFVGGAGGPECVIVCEGIETGFAIWMACGLPVLAMVSTAGVQNICFPPEWTDSQLGKLKRVIFAADHDAFKVDRKWRPGMHAARMGAGRLREKHLDLAIEIVVPTFEVAPALVGPAPGKSDEFGDVLLGASEGKEGKTVDWLDVFLEMGADVVWKGITGGKYGKAAERQSGKGEDGSREVGRDFCDAPDAEDRGSSVPAGSDSGWGSGDFGGGDRGDGGRNCDQSAAVISEGEKGVSAAEKDRRGKGDAGESERGLGIGEGCFSAGRYSSNGGSEERGGGGRKTVSSGEESATAGRTDGRSEQGGDDGGGEKNAGSGDKGWRPKILPRGHLAQAREYLKCNEALSASAAGRAMERWELTYSPAAKGWLEYVGTHYEPVPGELLASRVLNHFEDYWMIKAKAEAGDRTFIGKDGQEVSVRRAGITYGNAESVVASMVGDCAVKAESLPAWGQATFDGAGMPEWNAGARKAWAAEQQRGKGGAKNAVIAVKNGLLRVDALMENKVVLEKHTPRYVSLTCAPYDLPVELIQRQIDEDPEDELAGGDLCRKLCPEWLKFLKGASDDCEIWQRELGKFFGLCLTDRVMDRAAFLIGQPRTGKGTIAETLIEVLGESNVVTSRLASIVGRHELHNFVGKSMLLFDELEVGHQTDTAEAVGRLKTIIAGTPVSADPKHKDAFTFRVLGKVMITANKIPRLRDASGALADRLIVFPMGGESHRGREDYGLKGRLKAEARGILVWSLFHLRILLKQGRLHQPPEGEKALENFRRLSSPIYAFLKDCMVVHPPTPGEEGTGGGGGLGGGVEESLLRRLYEAWANDAGVGRMGQESFLADLMATVKNVRRESVEKVGESKKTRVLLGIRPRLFGEDEERAMKWRAEKPFIVWQEDIDRLDHYGFQFPAEGKRGEQYPDAGTLLPT